MATFTIPLRNKQLLISVEECPIEIISRPLRCGQKYEHEVTRRVGVKKEHLENLEANVNASLGIKDIAQLESSIKSSVGQTFTFEEAAEIKDKIAVEAPPFGRLNLLIYQFRQTFCFECTERYLGFFRRTWTLTVEKWLERYIDETTRIEYDPACGGERKGEPEKEQQVPAGVLNVQVAGSNYSLWSEFIQEGGKIYLPNLNITTEASIEEISAGSAEVDATLLPPYVRFLAGIKDEKITLTFRVLIPPIVNLEHPIQTLVNPSFPTLPKMTLTPLSGFIPSGSFSFPTLPAPGFAGLNNFNNAFYPSNYDSFQNPISTLLPPSLGSFGTPQYGNFNDPNWFVRGTPPSFDPPHSPKLDFFHPKPPFWDP